MGGKEEFRMRKWIAVVAVGSFVAAVAVGASSARTPASGARTISVGVKDDFFDTGGKKVRIRRGSSVRWRWIATDNPHNVVGRRVRGKGKRDRRFRSSVKRSGRYTKRFRTTGRWRVICEIHPLTMRMSVTVRK